MGGGLQEILQDLYQATIYKDRWMQYIQGLGVTLSLAALACLIGVAIGVMVAIVRYAGAGKKSIGWRLANALCSFYTTVIRGTPIIVQLLISYTVLFSGGFQACVFAFGINSGAYVSEVIRGGIASVDPGQAEAGRSLGLSRSLGLGRSGGLGIDRCAAGGAEAVRRAEKGTAGRAVHRSFLLQEQLCQAARGRALPAAYTAYSLPHPPPGRKGRSMAESTDGASKRHPAFSPRKILPPGSSFPRDP